MNNDSIVVENYTRKHMLLIEDGSSEYYALVWIELGNVICLCHFSSTQTAVVKFDDFTYANFFLTYHLI